MGNAGESQLCSLKTASRGEQHRSSLMMMPAVLGIVMVTVSTVSAAFGLKRGLHPGEVRSKAKEHVLDHMIGPNAKNMVSNFGRQMAISQMPGEAH
jgi:hypothetical protein